MTDRIDIAVDVPFVRIGVGGVRTSFVNVDGTFDGDIRSRFTADTSSFGLGDVLVRAKALGVRSSGVELSGVVNVRLATGDADNLLGVGTTQTKVLAAWAFTRSRVAPHANVGYVFGGNGLTFEYDEFGNQRLTDVAPSEEFDYTFGGDIIATPRLTFDADVIIRSVRKSARLPAPSFRHQQPEIGSTSSCARLIAATKTATAALLLSERATTNQL